MIIDAFIAFRNYAKLPFRFTCHVLRRTFATQAYGIGIDVPTISMCLGNTPEVCMRHYIISSSRNYDAFDVVNAYTNGYILKTNNLFFNQKYLSKKEKQDEKLQSN
jgi:integrase